MEDKELLLNDNAFSFNNGNSYLTLVKQQRS